MQTLIYGTINIVKRGFNYMFKKLAKALTEHFGIEGAKNIINGKTNKNNNGHVGHHRFDDPEDLRKQRELEKKLNANYKKDI
jgi:hypothetical protein